MHGLFVPSLYCPMCLLSTTENSDHQSFPALGADQVIMDCPSYVLNSPIFLSLILNHGKKVLSNSFPDHISSCILKCVGHCSPASQERAFQPWIGNADLLSSCNPVPLGYMSHSVCVLDTGLVSLLQAIPEKINFAFIKLFPPEHFRVL